MKPIIGITPSHLRETLAHGTFDRHILSLNYTNAVLAAGGIPVVLPPQDEHADALLDRLDGLLLSGGADIDPAVYGPTPGPKFEHLCKERGLIARIGRDFAVLAPPLTTPEDALHQMIDIFEAGLVALRA